jgi:tellurite resistance protein
MSKMTPSETKSIVTLSLLAAFVDGEKHERERAEIKRIAEGLSQADGVNLPTLYQDVLMKRVSLASVAGELKSTESRQLAYEMAVCVCDADGTQSQAERLFLTDVRTSLGLDASAAGFSQQAEEHRGSGGAAPVTATAAAGTAVAAATGSARPLVGRRPPRPTRPSSTNRSSTPPSSTARSSCCPRRCRPWRSFRCR